MTSNPKTGSFVGLKKLSYCTSFWNLCQLQKWWLLHRETNGSPSLTGGKRGCHESSQPQELPRSSGVVKSLLEHKVFVFQWFWVHTRWCSLSADAGRFSCGSFLEPQQWTRNTDSEASKMSKRVQRLSNGIFISIPSQALSQGSGLYALWVCRVLSQSEPSRTRIASLEVRLGTSLEWNGIQPSKESLVLCSYIIMFAQTCQLGARKGAVL